ncbi:hypothetical protein QL285_069732 [Trifolium repens]|nr:hypothetical protein QL285_069732 [Trifolium repens]
MFQRILISPSIECAFLQLPPYTGFGVYLYWICWNKPLDDSLPISRSEMLIHLPFVIHDSCKSKEYLSSTVWLRKVVCLLLFL